MYSVHAGYRTGTMYSEHVGYRTPVLCTVYMRATVPVLYTVYMCGLLYRYYVQCTCGLLYTGTIYSVHVGYCTPVLHCGSKKNAPTLADYNYDPVQSILIIFSKLFVNDHKSCPVVKFSTSPHMCCHYNLWITMLYFALITLLIARNAPTSDHCITSISVKNF